MATHNYKKITKQLGISYLFHILTFILSALAIFFLTRTLSVKEFGVYSILSATIAILTVILPFGLPQFIITKLPGFNHNKKIKSLFSILFYQLICLLFLLLILFIPHLQNLVLSYLKIEDYQFEFKLSIFVIFIGVFFNILSAYISAKREMEFVSFIGFLNNCFWVLLIIIFFLLFRGYDLNVLFIILLIGAITSFVITLFYLRKDIYFFFKKIRRLSWILLRNALSFSLPLTPYVVGVWLITVSDRYLINYFNGKEFVGIYTLVYSLVFIILAFSSVITGVMYPYIARAWSNKKNHQILFNAQLKYSLMIILPAMAGLIVLREQIITLVSGVGYLSGSSAIAILIPFPLLASLINLYTSDLLLRGKTKLVAWVYVGGALLNIALNIILVPKWNINGSSAATTVSYFFMFLAFYFVSRKQFSWDFNFLRILRMVFASILMGGVVLTINPQIYVTKIFSILFGIILYVILLFLFRIFVKEEYKIMASFLPKRLKALFRLHG